MLSNHARSKGRVRNLHQANVLAVQTCVVETTLKAIFTGVVVPILRLLDLMCRTKIILRQSAMITWKVNHYLLIIKTNHFPRTW
jgi:hypothetical protein